MVMVVHSSLRRVAVVRVRTKDLRYLSESTIEAPGMLKHVALQKTNVTTINPIGHPNAGNCHRPWYWQEIYPDYGASR